MKNFRNLLSLSAQCNFLLGGGDGAVCVYSRKQNNPCEWQAKNKNRFDDRIAPNSVKLCRAQIPSAEHAIMLLQLPGPTDTLNLCSSSMSQFSAGMLIKDRFAGSQKFNRRNIFDSDRKTKSPPGSCRAVVWLMLCSASLNWVWVTSLMFTNSWILCDSELDLFAGAARNATLSSLFLLRAALIDLVALEVIKSALLASADSVPLKNEKKWRIQLSSRWIQYI